MTSSDRLQSFSERYESGQVPWDDQLPPPEVITLAEQLRPGRALDLGSGYGRTSIYLAQRGWKADGIEFVDAAVKESRRRAREAGVEAAARFYLGDVTSLEFLQKSYDLAIDIGCMHTLTGLDLERYRDGLLRLLKPKGIYLLFAHLRSADDKSDEQARWVEERTLLQCFDDGFELTSVVHGITQVSDGPPWPSAWFQFRRS
jgi:cyclopropane fatty-acyl-phospholipid synthase-like methyltransferase